jgi:acyl carrier protein
MSDKDLEQKLLDLVSEEFDKTPEEIQSAENWKNLDLTSLDSMELIFILEDEFKIEIPDEEYPNLYNFKQLVNYIKENVK